MFSDIQGKIFEMLKEKLPSYLHYHNYEHTLDVIEAAERIAKAENVSNEELALVKTAALFHDVGYIYSRENHEQKSCDVAREMLSGNGINKDDIEKVCDLILATRVPQIPNDKLSEIICDADLDYLGRDDYFSISNNVYKEFKNFGIVKDENDWKHVQVKFFESHRYFTKTSKDSRNKKKEENLKKIKESLIT